MLDTAAQRINMVAAQLRPNDVTDIRIREAMLTVPRELFTPPAMAPVAYAEACVPLGGGRILMDPRSLAKLLQFAEITESDCVLDIGCGTGYSTAVLSRLASQIVAVEEDKALATQAESNLGAIGVTNVRVQCGLHIKGCPEHGPYDVVFLNGSIDIEPATLLSQLKEGGRLVAIKREGASGQARLYQSRDGSISQRGGFNAQLPLLPGFEKRPNFVF